MQLGRYVLIAAVLTSLALSARAQSQDSRFSVLEISAKKPQLLQGKHVVIDVRFTNTSDEVISCYIHAGGFGKDYSFNYNITDENGEAVPPIIHNHQEIETFDLHPCDLAPGETQNRQLDLSYSYEFSHPGTYHIQLSRLATGQPGDGRVKSNVLAITLLPATKAEPAAQ